MMVVIGTARARNGCRAELVAALDRMVAATEHDDGCVEYRFAADVRDPDVIVGVELWRDRAALDDHMTHDHTATFLAAVPDLVDGAPVMHVFEVAP